MGLSHRLSYEETLAKDSVSDHLGERIVGRRGEREKEHREGKTRERGGGKKEKQGSQSTLH